MVWVVLAAAYVYTTTPVPASTRFRSPFTNRTTHPPSGKVSYEQRAFGGGNSGGGGGGGDFTDGNINGKAGHRSQTEARTRR